jgi:hypothetical protein
MYSVAYPARAIIRYVLSMCPHLSPELLQELLYCIVLYCRRYVKLHIGYSEPRRTVGPRCVDSAMMHDASIVPLDLALQYLTLSPIVTM